MNTFRDVVKAGSGVRFLPPLLHIQLSILFNTLRLKSLLMSRGFPVILGALCIISCLAYPFGWSNNSEVLQICGHESGSFKLGEFDFNFLFK